MPIIKCKFSKRFLLFVFFRAIYLWRKHILGYLCCRKYHRERSEESDNIK